MPQVIYQPTTTVYTIGHSTRTIDAFVKLLKDNGVSHLVDVRTVPRSRHNPQFNRETLPERLSAVGIGYTHIPGLGGLRHPLAESPNTGWRNDSFRGYADYMQTPQFEEALHALIEIAQRDSVAIMCAEAVPWRCHRSLIADALLVRDFTVEDIMGEGKTQEHKLTPWARVEGKRITYPTQDEGLPG